MSQLCHSDIQTTNSLNDQVRDSHGRIKTEIVGIDAVRFAPDEVYDQYRRHFLIRELDKAYCGFVPSILSCHDRPPQIATGMLISVDATIRSA